MPRLLTRGSKAAAYMTIQSVASLDQVRKALALAVKERRLALGSSVTQEDVAFKANISVRHFQKLESGTANPRLDTLLAIAKALQTNLQSLLDRAEEIASKRGRAG